MSGGLAGEMSGGLAGEIQRGSCRRVNVIRRFAECLGLSFSSRCKESLWTRLVGWMLIESNLIEWNRSG